MKFDDDLSSEPTNELLYSGKFHYVISGLGAWVPGYVLLVTNQHFDNFSLAPDERRASSYRCLRKSNSCSWRSSERLRFSNTVPSATKKRAGGCINHAHVHFIAKNVDLCRDLKRQFRPIAIRNGGSSSPSPSSALKTPYLYVKQKGRGGPAFLVGAPAPDAVLETKGGVSKIGMSEYWDYKP